MKITDYISKDTIRQIIPAELLTLYIVKREHPDYGWLGVLKNTKLVHGKGRNQMDKFVSQSTKMFKMCNITAEGEYLYPYDSWVARVTEAKRTMITSVTVDYKTVLDSKLPTIEERLDCCKDKFFKERELKMTAAIRQLAIRCKDILVSQNTDRAKVLTGYFNVMLDRKPETLDEAIQKLMFYNAVFWQVGHWQNGLGRLDMILNEYYLKDLKAGVETRESAKVMLKEMVLLLGRDMKAKSRALIGDTGQYILLGGIGDDNSNIDNELTEIFLEIFTEIKIPDPKLIIRVNQNTTDAVWKKSVDCILTGCGSPLIMNESLIINSMKEFGYAGEDVWNMGTSACWEPLIIGKSFDQNNPLLNIPIIDSLTKLIHEKRAYDSFESFMIEYKKRLIEQVENCTHDVPFDCSPLYSLFFDSCIDRERDFSDGGAVYAWHGVQIASFPNTVNALMNIKKYVFDDKLLTLGQCSDAIKNNYAGYEDVQKVFLGNSLKFGNTEKSVVDLTNDLMNCISDKVSTMTLNGEKLKVGYSSSHYILISGKSPASVDGRKNGEPYAVHLSPVSQKIGIQEVLDFAGALDYSGNKLNGNVVDFIIPKAFADNPDKLRIILKNALTGGVFELQLNVLDADTLKDAKAHPEKYPTLVVRIWGFSAYFNDLPEEYKDNLIKRAESYAG